MGIADFYEDSSANRDDLAELREYLAEARKAQEYAKSDIMADLVALRDEVLGPDESVNLSKSGKTRKTKVKGTKSAIANEYPHTLVDAEGRSIRYKVLPNGHFVLKAPRMHEFSLKRDNFMQALSEISIWGQSETIETMDPLDVICIKETIREKWDNLGELGQNVLINLMMA